MMILRVLVAEPLKFVRLAGCWLLQANKPGSLFFSGSGDCQFEVYANNPG